VYLQPPAGGRRRMATEEPQPVGYIFLPETHTAISPHGGRLRATAMATQQVCWDFCCCSSSAQRPLCVVSSCRHLHARARY